MGYQSTCKIRAADSGEMIAKATSTSDSSPVVARNGAVMKATNHDDVEWEKEGDYIVDCYVG